MPKIQDDDLPKVRVTEALRQDTEKCAVIENEKLSEYIKKAVEERNKKVLKKEKKMEQTGKVIIFDSETDAKIWFDIIEEMNKLSKAEAIHKDFIEKYGTVSRNDNYMKNNKRRNINDR